MGLAALRLRGRPAAIAAAIVASLVFASRASAGASPVPGVPPSVAAGERILLTWGALPDRVDEFEILLSVDGGARAAIRATASLDPNVRTLAWEVPNLPSRAARLKIRFGEGGREIESAWSAPFEIRPGRRRLEPVHEERGEIALGRETSPPLEAPPAAAPAPVLSAARSSCAAALRSLLALELPSRTGVLPRSDGTLLPSAAATSPLAPQLLLPLRL